MLPLEKIKSQIQPNQSFTTGDVLAILDSYDNALIEHIERMKTKHQKDFKYLTENKESTEFDRGDANGAFWAMVEMRGWVEAQ